MEKKGSQHYIDLLRMDEHKAVYTHLDNVQSELSDLIGQQVHYWDYVERLDWSVGGSYFLLMNQF